MDRHTISGDVSLRAETFCCRGCSRPQAIRDRWRVRSRSSGCTSVTPQCPPPVYCESFKHTRCRGPRPWLVGILFINWLSDAENRTFISWYFVEENTSVVTPTAVVNCKEFNKTLYSVGWTLCSPETIQRTKCAKNSIYVLHTP